MGPGAVQIELSVVEYGHEDENGSSTHTISFAPINLKLGLTERADLQLLFNPFERVEADGGGDADGVGAFGVRSKIRLWGLEGSASAGAAGSTGVVSGRSGRSHAVGSNRVANRHG